jgi:hypothetical protein|uniref:BLUF domain-containing protein n=1 Tax=Eutreptiella gymnastica TaxID=73025 RepID=A0A7S4FZ17_9EUGL|mmetsp:Transcript_82763/g.138122  ORF Transcript_82763/g.138122 Transcript_82763/m.138122 type:complete len:238 (+) Transcript_82763:134-847(+)|eukprot:CAMPEP_0174283666 /NCGR_PEP_ID=MMETSP0809-20121228/4383_1 /TAXON_ID=73025 ORGANISM="Eutreptiella gymnastica-like, Strain CCMP1594" /NCGR_SAMPLE_ID=MMETSP0809 /ASSEMBLY_ACC=CAM_ASM_000658 /LENGTH=237 /DNA_ID=CAMNT_0015378743 /DNA_START=134 /DNA_END=847 /DNA_ORIENTATION=+
MSEYAEDEEQEHRKSLLDVICSHVLRDKPVLSRVMFAGRRTHKEEALKGIFEDLTDPSRHSYEGTGGITFTGIFVETASNFIHFLEGEPKNILSLLANLHSNAAFMDKMDDVQILSYTDDIVDRSWPKWAALVVDIPGKAIKKDDEDATIGEIVNQIQRFQELGSQIFTKEKLQIETYLAAVKNSHPDLLPTVAMMDGVLDSGFCLTLDEFLFLYNKPVDITLQSELVWPIPPPLKY